VHEFRIEIAVHTGKLLTKPLELNREDLPKGEVEAFVESNPQFLRRSLGRDRHLETLDRRFELRCG
jgi:hypothetical protein